MPVQLQSIETGKAAKGSVLNGFIIQHRMFKEIVNRFDECRRSVARNGEPACLLLRGGTGVGKSTIMKQYLANHPPHREGDRKKVPVLTAVIPIPATMKNLATELLDRLGDPFADRGTLEQRTRRLRKLLVECGTEVIVLDEFQHFIERKSQQVILDVSDWLKNLITNTNIPVILIGLTECNQVLDANPQLLRRFGSQILLPPFTLNHQKNRQEFEKALQDLEEKLPHMAPCDGGFVPHAERFHAATGGRIALLVKLMRDAERLAGRKWPNEFGLGTFEAAFRAWTMSLPPARNPFSTKWDGVFRDPLVSEFDESEKRQWEKSASRTLGASKA